MENYEEEDACGSELIPDSPRPPIFVDFSAKPTPSEIRNELLDRSVPSEEKTETKSRRSRKPRASVKALKGGPKKQNPPQAQKRGGTKKKKNSRV